VLDYLKDETHTGSTGIVFMDFAGVDKSLGTSQDIYEVKGLQLVQALIAQNFRTMSAAITSVHSLSTDAEEWYDLQGRKLATRPSTPGIYVHLGRKTIVK